MDPDLAVHVIAEDRVVVELHEQLTAPGPALELHVVIDSTTGRATALVGGRGGAATRRCARRLRVGGNASGPPVAYLRVTAKPAPVPPWTNFGASFANSSCADASTTACGKPLSARRRRRAPTSTQDHRHLSVLASTLDSLRPAWTSEMLARARRRLRGAAQHPRGVNDVDLDAKG
jgi:hypothetical protein